MTNDPLAISEMFETVSLGAPQNAVGFVMWRVMHRYIRAVDQALRPFDLTHLQFTVLALVAWLARAGDAATQAELARFGDIHQMQVSNIVKALEHKTMVERSMSPENALAKRVAITAKGVAALRSALPVVIATQEKMFGTQGMPGGALLDALHHVDAAR